MRTMYLVKKGEYLVFTTTLELAQIARRVYPQLKGGRIKNVLQAWPSRVAMGSLYRNHEQVSQ